MPNRPTLKPGDICKYHKRCHSKDILVVLSIAMGTDSSDRFCVVIVNEHHRNISGEWIVTKKRVLRKNLWKTGANVHGNTAIQPTGELKILIDEMVELARITKAERLMSEINNIPMNKIPQAVKPQEERPKVQDKGAAAALKSWADS